VLQLTRKNVMVEQQELIGEIRTVAEETKKWARSSFRAAYAVTGVAVAASIVGSVLDGSRTALARRSRSGTPCGDPGHQHRVSL
jgi:hypothetical protein